MAYGARKTEEVKEKVCVWCGKTREIDRFYKNAGWVAQGRRDAWCKFCIEEHCQDKITIQEYFFNNNRLWKDDYWEKAEKQAIYKAATDPEYIKTESESKKKKIINKYAVKGMIQMMSLSAVYSYVENIKDDGGTEQQEFDPESPVGKLEGKGISLEDGGKTYSQKWNGTFTDRQIKYLDEKYAELEEDFALDNGNLRDYAKNICKASLDAAMNFDRYQRGLVERDAYQGSMKMFDTLSKSATFAQCAKKQGGTTGMGSLGEIILRLEVTGKISTRQVTFPPDDVDKINADFAHVLTAIGSDRNEQDGD